MNLEPLATTPRTVGAPAGARAPLGRSRLRVLIIEDDVEAAGHMAEDLGAFGLETVVKHDGLDALEIYWSDVRTYYAPFDTGPKSGSAQVYLHEMPGGQYTNLREQAESMGLGPKWHEVARMYAAVNMAFGDIVKVTPSRLRPALLVMSIPPLAVIVPVPTKPPDCQVNGPLTL